MNHPTIHFPASSPRVLHEFCRGVKPLDAFLWPWMQHVLTDQCRARRLLDEYDSPVHVHVPSAMIENASRLEKVAGDRGINFRVIYARQANRYLGYLDQARQHGLGVIASTGNELQQCLDRRTPAKDLVYAAAIKDASTVELAISTGTTIVIDNLDELDIVAARLASKPTAIAQLALRLRGFSFPCGIHQSTFGVDVADAARFLSVADKRHELLASRFCWRGVQFQLGGDDGNQIVAALRRSIPIVKQLRQTGHPVNYIDFALEPVSPDWLATMLDDKHNDDGHNGQTLTELLRLYEIELRCQPGGSLLDGCGMTLAEVMFRKRDQDWNWVIGLKMDRTDFNETVASSCVDPVLIPSGSGDRCEAGIGYFVGATCMESGSAAPRKMRFNQGVAVGDTVALPNTAAYLMRFLESQTHPFDLPENVTVRID